MKIFFYLFTVILILASSIATADTFKRVNFDLEKSKIVWTGSKVSGSHNGTLKLQSALGQIHEDKTLSGVFEIDMNSLVVSDIENAEYNAKLKNHLKNEDFCNVVKFPTVTFKIVNATPEPQEKTNYSITGELTVKGLTKQVKFPAVIEVKEGFVKATGKAVINRTDFDIKYNSGSFFENLGDKLILDDFSVEISLEGKL